ncbi:hypothetical protein E3J74_06890 [Candidatus Bathyarchaeota archaeon]|nr:MAG: hypothetical protein E3J74_06890 [Candidatus Bathyarchaeota archaeon]
MEIHKRLWNWCRRPKRPVSTKFTRLAIPLCVSVLIGGLLLTAGVTIVLFPMAFFKVDEGPGVAEVVEVIEFPGGAIVVTNHTQVPGYASYISIRVTSNVTSKEDFLAYIDSRTKALLELADSINPNETVLVSVTFKSPLKPAEFTDFCRNYVADAREYVTAYINETTGEVLGSGILKGPNPQDPNFEEALTSVREGLKVTGVIAFKGLMKVDVAKAQQLNNSKILLVDLREDLAVRSLMEKYRSEGFDVITDSPIEWDIYKEYLKYASN